MTHRRPTSTFISRLAISVVMLLLVLAIPANAQKRNAATKKNVAERDTVALFRGFSVSVDAVGPVMMAVSDYGQYEANLRVNLKDKYFPVFELGIGDANHHDDAVTGISVKTRAPYGRVGCDFNVLRDKHGDYRAYVGFRYAYSSFDFKLSHPGVEDPIWGGVAEYGTDETCSSHWIEGVFAVDAKVLGPLRLGWSVRYRRRIVAPDCSVGDVWYIPGFGRSKKTCIGGTFNIALEI